MANSTISALNDLHSLLSGDAAVAKVVLNPMSFTSIKIRPMLSSARVLHGTVSIVFAILMQFFYFMALNVIASKFELYASCPCVTI